MAIKIKAGYDIATGKTVEAVVSELVKAHARSVSTGVVALTDSSAGTPGTALTALSVAHANAANSGTNLAQKAATETAYGTVKDALLELATKANEYATKMGVTGITYNGGGTAADGTIGAVTVAVTAAATGVQATSMNTLHTTLNTDFYIVGALVNKLLVAQGYTPVTLYQDTFASTVAAITVDGGTAADPGVTKVAVDAQLVVARNNVATLATKLNSLNDGLGNALVVLV